MISPAAAAAWRASQVYALTLSGALLSCLTLVLGIAGSFSNLATGATSNGGVGITLSLSISFLRACVSCASTSTTQCAAAVPFLDLSAPCTSNVPAAGSAFGSAQLSAGLAFALLAWLLELAALPLGVLAALDAAAAMQQGGAGARRSLRLPAVLALVLAATLLRTAALACGYQWAVSKMQSYFDYEASLPGGFSNSIVPDSAAILLGAALFFGAVNVIFYGVAAYQAQPEAAVPRQPFFFNLARQPPVPKTLTRGCSENSTVWVSAVLTLATAAVAIAWQLFANKSTPWPLPIAVTALLLAICSKWLADFVQEQNETVLCFLHLVAQYALTFALLFFLVMGFVTIDAANEVVEQDWVSAQNTVLIPFTTLLDQKAYNTLFGQACFIIGLLALVSSLMPLTESWAAVGGLVRLVQGRFAILVPEFAVLVAVAALTLYYDQSAATVAVYAVPHTTTALVWQSAAAALSILAVVLLTATAGVWGSTIGYHVAHALLMAPLALITLVTACVTLQRAALVVDFVRDNWTAGADIHRFVGPDFSAAPFDKYAVASYVPMAAAGAMGIVLSLLLWASVAMHWGAAAVLFFVGPELYALSTGAQPAATALAAAGGKAPASELVMAAGLAAAGVKRGASAYGGGGDMAADTPFLAAPTPVRGDSNTLFAPAYGSASAALVDSGARGRSGGGGGGYGSAGTPGGGGGFRNGPGGAGNAGGGGGEYDHVSLEDGGGDGGGGGGGGNEGLSLPAGLLYPISRGTSRSIVDLSQMIGRSLPADTDTSGYKAAMTAATRAYAQYLTAHGFTPIPLQSAWRESELGATVGTPSLAALWSAWKLDIAYQWVTTRTFILAAAVISLAVVVGVSVGLSRLAAAGTCSVLVVAPVSVTYSKVYSIAAQYELGFPVGSVAISNTYPYGGIDVEAPTITKGVPYNAANHNLTVFVTYYASSMADIPSYEYFLASVNQTAPHTGDETGDDDPLYYDVTTITVAPPPGQDPLSDCVGATVRVLTTAFNVRYALTSTSALVSVLGNFPDLAGDDIINTRAAFENLLITTDSAPVNLTDIFQETKATVPPPTDYPDYAITPSLVVRSRTGDVSLTRVTGSGIAVTTSGTVRSFRVVSTVVHQCGSAVCGDISYTVTGDGRIAHTASLGGSRLTMQSDRGAIVIANSLVLFATVCRLTSGSGNIILSGVTAVYGNETYITATNGGSVSMTSVFTNRAIVATQAAGTISVVVEFMGSPTPPADKTSLVLPYAPRNYSLPLLQLVSERGDISVLSCGGSPTLPNAADYASIDFRSTLGNVKAEVSGGGVNADYNVHSDRGSEVIEINGLAAPTTGHLGDTPGSGANFVRLYSAGGDVQLSLLASPY